MWEVLGLPSSGRISLAPDAREIRISWGIAVAIPHEFVRIVDYRGEVTGDIGRYWDIRSFGEPGDHEDAWAAFRRDMQTLGCGEIERGLNVEACLVETNPEPDWELVLDRLDSLGIWTLPDEGELDLERGLILDCWGITVETHMGGRYRAYSYSNPDDYPLPETRAAAAIAGVVRDLSSQYWKPAHSR